MERLTKRMSFGLIGNNERVEGYPLYKVAQSDPLDHGIIGQCFNKLADYEDAEEKGLLLKLKLKVGDTFWEVNDNFLEPAIYQRKAHSLQHVMYCMDRLGKTTFLTCQEAELELANRLQSHAEAIMDERNGR